jgi:hypothetical protein
MFGALQECPHKAFNKVAYIAKNLQEMLGFA